MAFNYGSIFGEYGDEKVSGTSKLHPYGTRLILPDGRIFKYGAMSSAAAIGAGQVCQTAAGVANHDMDLVVTAAAAVGAKAISLTLGATAATEDQYADGYIGINDGAGEGHVYKIRQHDAIGSGGSGTINLVDGDTISEALTTSSLVALHKSPYKDVIIYPTTTSGYCVGVASAEIAASSYGWFETWGLAKVLCDVAFVPGNHIRVSDNTAGSAEPLDRDGSNENDEEIGVAALIAPVTTDYGFVQLKISP
jgi:hypothetical protein